MWLLAVSLMLGGLTILRFTSRQRRGLRHAELGCMSQRWLAEHRAGSRC
jgi:hypothetical protein